MGRPEPEVDRGSAAGYEPPRIGAVLSKYAEVRELQERAMRLAATMPVAVRETPRIASGTVSDPGIPPRYAGADVLALTEGAQPGTPRWRVRSWAMGLLDHVRHGRGLVLVGPTGTGKSMLAAGLTRRAMTLGISSRWVSVASWLEDLETLRQLSREQWAREQDRIRRVRLLALDDLGAEDVRSWARRLDAIVSARYDQGLSLLVTTNLPPDALRRAYGDRVASRLAGTCDWIELSGPDLRLVPEQAAQSTQRLKAGDGGNGYGAENLQQVL